MKYKKILEPVYDSFFAHCLFTKRSIPERNDPSRRDAHYNVCYGVLKSESFVWDGLNMVQFGP